MISNSKKKYFLENGFCILENVISRSRLNKICNALEELIIVEGEHAGSEGADHSNSVRRLCNLFTKGKVFEDIGIEPISLEFARLVIGNDIRLQAMNFHDPVPGEKEAYQSLHADRSFFPNSKAYINVCWVLDEMTYENGATRIVPGSQNGQWPKDTLNDDESFGTLNNEIYAECPAGSLIFIHGDTWHGGRANFSNSTRRVIHVGYACPNTPPQQDISSTITKAAKIRLGEKCSLLPYSLKSFGLDNNWLSKSTIEKVIQNSVLKN